ncbi:MAG: hypothetical protein ACE5JG_08000, partial [Planctomycetota bacterium]
MLALSLLLPAACGGGGKDAPAPAAAAAPTDPEEWWRVETTLASGKERLLSPRELRVLLERGRRLGFDRDAAWWRERRRWVFSRILEVDSEDPQANRAMGRRRLRSYAGFDDLWERMNASPVPDGRIDALVDRFEPRV